MVENKGVPSGIAMRSGEFVNRDNGAVVRSTPAAIEGIASNKAVFRALEAVPGSPAGRDDAPNWCILLRPSRNNGPARWWLSAHDDRGQRHTPPRPENQTLRATQQNGEARCNRRQTFLHEFAVIGGAYGMQAARSGDQGQFFPRLT